MRRAILLALGIGAIITSAAAFSVGSVNSGGAGFAADEQQAGPLAAAHTQRRAREAQRADIESRYLADRAKCAGLGGGKRDRCLIEVHAARGRLLLATAAPYEVRNQD